MYTSFKMFMIKHKIMNLNYYLMISIFIQSIFIQSILNYIKVYTVAINLTELFLNTQYNFNGFI